MSTILTTIFSFIIDLVNLILYPIDALIENFLPDLSNALSSISSFLDLALEFHLHHFQCTFHLIQH